MEFRSAKGGIAQTFFDISRKLLKKGGLIYGA